MPEYRAYYMNEGHTVSPPLEFVCDDDVAAIAWAGRLVADWDIELCQRGRLVVRLPQTPRDPVSSP